MRIATSAAVSTSHSHRRTVVDVMVHIYLEQQCGDDPARDGAPWHAAVRRVSPAPALACSAQVARWPATFRTRSRGGRPVAPQLPGLLSNAGRPDTPGPGRPDTS